MLYRRDTSGCYRPASRDTILAAARRLSSCQLRRGAAITSPFAAREAIGLKLAGLEYESFACLFLDGRHQVLAWRELFHGSVNRATVHPREIVKEALARNSAALILVHNHPSGVAEPSRADEALTQTLKSALSLVDVRVIDHLIVAGPTILSFAERGLI